VAGSDCQDHSSPWYGCHYDPRAREHDEVLEKAKIKKAGLLDSKDSRIRHMIEDPRAGFSIRRMSRLCGRGCFGLGDRVCEGVGNVRRDR